MNMKRTMNAGALVGLVLLAAACGKQESESKTVEYFMQHADESKTMEKECENKGISPLADSPEARTCNAARTAARQRFLGIKK